MLTQTGEHVVLCLVACVVVHAFATLDLSAEQVTFDAHYILQAVRTCTTPTAAHLASNCDRPVCGKRFMLFQHILWPSDRLGYHGKLAVCNPGLWRVQSAAVL